MDHYCEIHGVKFFKTAKMKGFAHPIEGTEPTQWCNEEDMESYHSPDPEKEKVAQQKLKEEPVKEMTKADWAEKDRIKQHSIERQKALAEAVNWCIAKLQGGEDVKTVHIISIATIFESYLEDGNIKKED